MTRLDLIASARHLRAHLEPIWEALPDELCGEIVDLGKGPPQFAALRGTRRAPADRAVIVAAHRDLQLARRLGYKRVALLEHGIGQSYSNRLPAYPGGYDRDDVELFLSPNAHAAGRDQAIAPRARVEIVGCPRLDTLPRRAGGPAPVVAVSFHWDSRSAPEMRSAFETYREALGWLAARYQLIGHGHPMMQATLEPLYRRFGIELVREFDDVCRRADLYVAENTSTLFEFASTGRPVVVINLPAFRRDVEHGLRFWAASGVGVNCEAPAELVAKVGEALDDAPATQLAREEALDIVYAFRVGAGQRAAEAIATWLA